MLDRMTRQQFNEWLAYSELEPWDNEQYDRDKLEYQFDRLEHILARGFTLLCSAWTPEGETAIEPAELIPEKPDTNEPRSLKEIKLDDNLARQDAERVVARFRAAYTD